MKPFSPIYFISKNRKRCIILIFMMFLQFGIYVSGLYVTNPYDNWAKAFEFDDKLVTIYGNDTEDDLNVIYDRLVKDDNCDVLSVSLGQGVNWNTIMGFESGRYSVTFASVDDLKEYCRWLGLDVDCSKLTDGSLVLSDVFARNLGIKQGDVIDKDYDINIYGYYTVDYIADEEGYLQFYINSSMFNGTSSLLVHSDTLTGEELRAYILKMVPDYTHESLESKIGDQFTSFYVIYLFIVILMAVIMAVTINAAFVGMYQRRRFEFAVYKAIGIPKRKVFGKIIGELLCMDMIATMCCGVIFFLFLYLFNNIVLYPMGCYLRYYHTFALGGLLLCNVIVIVPLILTRCRQMSKADICDF